MSKNGNKLTWKRIVAISTLAILCIGGVELAACKYFNPDLYDQITAPVRKLFHHAGTAVASAIDDVSQHIIPSTPDEPEEEAPLESQFAAGPALTSTNANQYSAITQLVSRDNLSYLTGGALDIVYFRQSAPEWADLPYGTDTIGPYGCGPTAMAMAASSITPHQVNPEQMAEWAYKQGYWVSRSGSKLALIPAAAAAFGMDSAPLRDATADDLLLELSYGKLAVALVTAGHFTSGGHFILLRGTTLDGKVLVADPNSEERSLVAWDPQLILDELSASRDAGAPLWLLTPKK